MKNKGFTLVELMVIVAIIGLLVSITMTMWVISAVNKAAVNSYKTSMRSLQTAMEICNETGGTAVSGFPGDSICGGDEKYPKITPKCGSDFQCIVSGTGNDWTVTTDKSCRGCKISCTVERCSYIETDPGDCY